MLKHGRVITKTIRIIGYPTYLQGLYGKNVEGHEMITVIESCSTLFHD